MLPRLKLIFKNIIEKFTIFSLFNDERRRVINYTSSKEIVR